MYTLFLIILANFIISLASFVGVITLFFKEDILRKIVRPLVAFSAGSLLGGAFLHLLPESIERASGEQNMFLIAIFGFALFFLLEQFIHWHHCHKPPSEHKHPVTYLILFSDSIHNFLDGLAIGAAFLLDFKVGIATSVAILAHEIPQEFGDFGILIYGGWHKFKALFFNFLTGLTAVLGGVIAWWAAKDINTLYLLPFAAGNFIYIASSDLIPEIKHSKKVKNNLIHFSAFAFGILIMYLLLYLDID